MTSAARRFAVVAALLVTTSSAQAGPCTREIVHAQAHVDAAIEASVAVNGWKPQSLDAMRGYQPTPRSLAQAEGHNGLEFQVALDSLDRARDADRSGDDAVCRRELAGVQSILAQRKQ